MSTSNEVKFILTRHSNIVFKSSFDNEDLKWLLYLTMISWIDHIRLGVKDTPVEHWIRDQFTTHLPNDDVSKVFLQESNKQTLLNRWDLVESVLLNEATTDIRQEDIYRIILACCYDNVSFGPLPSDIIIRNDSNLDPITVIRQNHDKYTQITKALSNRLDDSDMATERDHGCLSSFCLIYGLRLFYAIIYHDNKINPSVNHRYTLEVLDGLLNDLTDLFTRSSNQWIYEGSDVSGNS